jgi:hypothetical protein
MAAVNGELLYVGGGSEGGGGITGVGVSGTPFFNIFPQAFFGFQTTQDYTGGVQGFTQARTGGRIAFASDHSAYVEGDLNAAGLPVSRIYLMNGDGSR